MKVIIEQQFDELFLEKHYGLRRVWGSFFFDVQISLILQEKYFID